jgi:hypothetical protein
LRRRGGIGHATLLLLASPDRVDACSANADALTVAGFLDRGRETGLATGATVSVISIIPVASRQEPIAASA